MAAIIRSRTAGQDRIEINKFQLTYKDVLDMNYLYTLVHEWLIENEFATKKDEDFPEVSYLQRENPQFGKEVWFRWRLQKYLPPEDTKIWRIDLDIDVHILGWKKVEMIVKDKKVKTDTAEVEWNVVPALVFDNEKFLEQNPWTKKWKKLIKTRLLRKQFDKYKFETFSQSMAFQNALKEYLEIQRYTEDKQFREFWDKAHP